MSVISISVPKSETKVSVDTSKLPDRVTARLVELGLTAIVRSAVNNKLSNEVEKALKAHNEPALKAFNDAEQASLAANPKYKVKSYKPDAKADEAFVKAFKSAIDPVAAANERIEALLAGDIRMARGEGGANKALMSLVKANIVAVLKSKGKKHRDALAMVGDDPMAFIEKTAAKRGGDDAEAVKAELAKLNAQYVEPARAMLAEQPADEGDETDTDDDTSDANDLL